MRRCSDISKSIIAVQSKGDTKALNDVVLAYHKGINLNETNIEEQDDISDYLGLYANDVDDMHLFKINIQKKESGEEEAQVDAAVEEKVEENEGEGAGEAAANEVPDPVADPI